MPSEVVSAAELEAQLLEQPEFRIMLRNAAVEVAQLAKNFYPGEKHRAWLAQGHHAVFEVVQEDGGKKVSVVNTDHGGHLVEWGTKDSPPYAPLRRAVRAAGLKLDESPKP